MNGRRWNGKMYNNKSEEVSEINDGNGHIKEYYDNGILKFEGTYLNGERHGEIKSYHDNGILKFEGKYLNGKRNGKGKEYNKDGEIPSAHCRGHFRKAC